MGKKKSKKGKKKGKGGGGDGDSAEAVAAARAQSELLALRSKLGDFFWGVYSIKICHADCGVLVRSLSPLNVVVLPF